MKNPSVNSAFLPPPRILTSGISFFFISAIAVIFFSSVQADPGDTVEAYHQSEQDLYASGTDVGAVMNSGGLRAGDRIIIYGDATFNQTVSNSPNVSIEPYNLGEVHTITAETTNRLFFGGYSYTFISDLFFQGNSEAVSGDGAFLNTGGCALNMNNVTINGFKSNIGGAIYIDFGGSLTITGTNFTFSNNTTNEWGGAIYTEMGDVTITGSNVTFSGNTDATNAGHDIFVSGSLSLNGSSVENKGTFSFDGGIQINESGIVCFNNADVTIAGREDVTNLYGFNETIFNNATLTANLDYIDVLAGFFELGDGVLTLNKGEDAATIKSTTNDGDIELHYDAQGAVSDESLFISSGRVDIQGCMEATIELDGTLSPGNSAGKFETTGDFITSENSTLIFEQEGSVYDQLIANNVTIAPDTEIVLDFSNFAPGAMYDIIIANGTLNVEQSWIDMIQRLVPDDFEALIYNGNTVRLQSTQEPQAVVPEPSTWALLVLGVIGLMYWRKRK